MSTESMMCTVALATGTSAQTVEAWPLTMTDRRRRR